MHRPAVWDPGKVRKQKNIDLFHPTLPLAQKIEFVGPRRLERTSADDSKAAVKFPGVADRAANRGKRNGSHILSDGRQHETQTQVDAKRTAARTMKHALPA